MKRGLTILLLGILLLSSLAIAADNDVPDTVTSLEMDTTDLEDAQDTEQQLKEIGEAIKKGVGEEDLKKLIDAETTVFSTPLPTVLEKPTRVIFKIPNEEITLEKFVVLLATLIGFLVLIYSIMELMPFLNESWQKLLASACVVAIISITGTITNITEFWFNLSEATEILAKLGKWTILIWILAGTAILIGFNKVARLMKHKYEKSEAEESGREIGLLSKTAEANAEEIRRRS